MSIRLYAGSTNKAIFVYIQDRPYAGAEAHVSNQVAQGFRPSTRASALAIKDREGEEGAQHGNEDQPHQKTEVDKADADRKTSEELEELQYQALMEKASKKTQRKRPAAATPTVKGKGKGTVVLKRPGAKLASAKAAGKVYNLKTKVTWSRKENDHKRIRNVYNCKMYDRAKRELKKVEHLSAEDYKATLQDVLKKAGEMWDKHMT